VSEQDWLVVCVEHTIGLEIVLDTSRTPSYRGSRGCSFSLFGDSANLDAR
jgi:hypothetical protein